ncbi:MAG: hypothetical protein ABIK09_03300 [Pseudomonadota bacterium]
MSRARATVGLALLALLPPAEVLGGGTGAPNWVVPGGQEEQILALVAPNRTLAPVLPGTWFDRIEITDEAIIFVVSGREPPAGPLSIHLGWDATAPSGATPPPWRLEVKGAAEAGALTESVALLRGRIEARLTPEVYDGLLQYVADSGGDLTEVAPDWIERVAGTFGLVWRERWNRGLVQYALRDVDATAPALPSPWILAPLLALVLAGIGFMVRRRRISTPVLAVAAAGLAALAAWWVHAPLSEAGTIVVDQPLPVLAWLVPAHREFAVAQVFLLTAIVSSILGIAALVRRGRGPGLGRVLLEAGAVAVVSLLVRLVLVAPNLYSRGGGGGERLLRYVPGEGGIGLVAAWVLPRGELGFIWSAVIAVAIFSSLGPPLLYLLGRSLRLSATASLVAGFALACWPLHAMISASDLLAAPVLTVGLAAWAFSARAAATDRPALLLPAAGLLAWAVWCRLDGILVLLPAVAMIAPAARGWLRRTELWGAAAWVGLAVVCRLLAWPVASGPEPWAGAPAVAALLVPGPVAFPWWLVLLIPGGVALRRRRALVLPVVSGLVAAAVSVLALRTLIADVAWVEGGAMIMPWAALIVGVGVQEIAGRLPGAMAGRALVASVLAGILVLPILHAGELEIRHGPAASDRAFREALGRMESRCGIVVDDVTEAALEDPARRYRWIAWEEFERDPQRPRGDQVISGATYRAPGCSEAPARVLTPAERFRKLPCWFAFNEADDGEYRFNKISDKSLCR